MRPIKFRAQDFTGTWQYGFIVKGNEQAIIIPVHKDGAVAMGINIYVKPETIGEFTSLYDKNHREIYEGDIIKVGGEKQKIEVRFVRGVFAFLWGGNLDDEFPTCSPTHEWAEVVCNIHDNPKMLKR
jgi:hypothetical protein